jgi:L-amino acid N-acyltransferase YncA
MITIRKATTKDQDPVWDISQQVIATGDTYVFSPDSPKEKMLAYWFGQDKHTYVATINNKVVGTFAIKDNQPGLGAHIANASYMTLPASAGQGVGKAMGECSITEAKRLGIKLCSLIL